MDSKTYSNWSAGTNNVAAPDRLPDGFARALVNLDIAKGGKLTLRPGTERIYEGSPRGVLALGRKLLVADGSQLVEINTQTNTSRVLRTIDASGRFSGCEHNGRLYFCTVTECLEYDGEEVRPWGVPDALNRLTTSAILGSLPDGYYRLAITFTDPWEREGGTSTPLVIRAEGGLSVLLPEPPAGHRVNLYASSPNGDALYLQHTSTQANAYPLNRVRDDTRALDTINRYAPIPSDRLVSHNGVLAMARGKLLELTMPLRPHLVDRVRGFYQYPAEIGELVSAGGLFVSADKSYALVMPETGEVAQRTLSEYPAIPGTGVTLPNSEGMWLTERGYVLLSGEQAAPVTESHFVPAPARAGASGVLDLHGAPRVITTTRAQRGQNRLAAKDRFTAEIRLP